VVKGRENWARRGQFVKQKRYTYKTSGEEQGKVEKGQKGRGN
jgi:hypothetical protein